MVTTKGLFFFEIRITSLFSALNSMHLFPTFLVCLNHFVGLLNLILFYSILSHNLGRSSGHHR